LNEVDMSDLNMEDLGRAPASVRLILAALLFGTVLFAGYYFMVKPKIQLLEAERARTVSLEEDYRVAATDVANIAVYKQQIAEIEHQFSLLVSQLPNETEVPGLLDDITDEGIGNGLSFSSIGLEPEVKSDVIVELPIKVDLEGGYHNIAQFISGISGMSRIVTVHDFEIKPVDVTKGKKRTHIAPGSHLSMTMDAKTYRYDELANTPTVATKTVAGPAYGNIEY
ncbi:MAG: type 4a pilus biogenesis protein PilO, partial [Pseudomonadota bacterium]